MFIAPGAGAFDVFVYGYAYDDSGANVIADRLSNVSAPAPGALALLGLGLFGIGTRRKLKAA